jgi:hypothetical protein
MKRVLEYKEKFSEAVKSYLKTDGRNVRLQPVSQWHILYNQKDVVTEHSSEGKSLGLTGQLELQ